MHVKQWACLKGQPQVKTTVTHVTQWKCLNWHSSRQESRASRNNCLEGTWGWDKSHARHAMKTLNWHSQVETRVTHVTQWDCLKGHSQVQTRVTHVTWERVVAACSVQIVWARKSGWILPRTTPLSKREWIPRCVLPRMIPLNSKSSCLVPHTTPLNEKSFCLLPYTTPWSKEWLYLSARTSVALYVHLLAARTSGSVATYIHLFAARTSVAM